MPFTSYNFQPTAISGCCGWYRARDLNLSDNSTVLTWNDVSGSGNHLVGSGLFQRSSNGFAQVAIDGIRGQGFAASGSNSLVNDPRNLTIFYVLSTNDLLNMQSLLSYEDSIHTYYGSYLGKNSGSSSGFDGWYYNSFLGQQNIEVNNVPYVSGEWFVRTDKSFANYLYLSKNSIQYGSGAFNAFGGTILTPPDLTGQLKLGYSNRKNPPATLNGKIREVILYGRSLEEGEVSAVETYLKFSNFINGNAAPLFIYGEPAGSSLIYNPNLTLFMQSSTSTSGITTLFTESASVKSSGVSLYIGSANTISSGINLFTESTTTISSGINMYVGGINLPVPQSGISLYSLGNSYTNSDVFPLYTTSFGPPSTSGQVTLFIFNVVSGVVSSRGGFNSFRFNGQTYNGLGNSSQGFNPMAFNSLNLYLNAGDHGSNTSVLSLYLQGPSAATGISAGTTLYLANTAQQITHSAKMFIRGLGTLEGGSTANNNMPLFLNTTQGQYNTISLYINSQIAASSVTLYTAGGSSGVNNHTTLYMDASPRTTSDDITLFILPTLSGVKSTTLYISGKPVVTKNTSLYTHGF